MKAFVEKIRLVVSAGFVEKVDAREETFEYSKAGTAIRRLFLHLIKRAKPFRKEIHFVYQFESRSERLSRSMDYLSSIRNIHHGERIFVVANGPSLRYSDLDLITREISIGSNLIHLAYEHTSWRPDYFTVSDTKVWAKMGPEVQSKHDHLILLDSLDPRRATVSHSSVRQLSALNVRKGVLPFSDNLNVGAFGGHTVTYFNLQLAHHLGAKSIVLLGLDHYYEQPKSRSRTIVVNHEQNHFHPDYRQRDEMVFKAPLEKMTYYFEKAHRFSESSGVRILNATPRTSLSVFPVTDLATVLRSPGR